MLKIQKIRKTKKKKNILIKKKKKKKERKRGGWSHSITSVGCFGLLQIAKLGWPKPPPIALGWLGHLCLAWGWSGHPYKPKKEN
jgi:hypothetical protein